MNKYSYIERVAAGFVAVILATILSAGAADGSWSFNGSGNWSDTTKWTNGTVADGADFTATFGDVITAHSTVTNGSDRAIGNITASDASHNYTISGANILTLDVTTGIPVIDVTTAGRTLTINSQISGADGLQKNGAGILIPRVANDYTGGTTINAGVLDINADTQLGNTSGGITLNGGQLFISGGPTATSRGITLNAIAGNTIALGNGVTATLNGALTGDGGVSFTKSGAGNSATTAILNSTSNDFKGALGIWANNSAVTVRMRSLADSVTANGNIIFGNGTQGQTFDWDSAGGASNHLTLNNRGIEFAGDGNTGATIVKSSTTQNLVINTGITATGTGGKALTVNVAGNNNEINGVISDGSGVLSFNKSSSGSGTLVLSATNSYTGSTAIGNGTLSVNTLANFGQNSSIGKGTSGVAITMGATSASGTLVYTGGAQSTDRTIKISGWDQNNAGGAIIYNNGAGKLTFTAATFNESYNASTATTRPLSLSGSNDGEIQGVIQDGGSNLNPVDGLPFLKTRLVKSDAGTWTLSGDNTYQGTTTVDGGTLLINGNSSSASNTVTVTGTGSTLGGTGTVGGNTTLNTGTILSPGASPGTLTFNQNLTLANGAKYNFEAGDLTDVKGTLTASNTWNLVLGEGFKDGGSVTLFTYVTAGTPLNITPNINTAGLGFTPSGSLSLTNTGSAIVLQGISIPSPSAGMLILIK